MRAIPKAALPVVEIIRRDVPRPEELPTLGFENVVLRWRNKKTKCPMGLPDASTAVAPAVGTSFAGGVCTDTAVKAFGVWWDQQTDPQAAVDAVWGE